MQATNGTARLPGSKAKRISGVLRLFRSRDEKGQALIELAVALPLLLLIATGILVFGLTLNNYLELTNAVTLAAQQVAASRDSNVAPASTNLCTLAQNIIHSAAPTLNPGGLAVTLDLGGAASCPGSTSLEQGESAEVIATYPCSLAVFGNSNLIPGCTLHAQITEIVQ